MGDQANRPGRYADMPAPAFDGHERSSCYVEMRDGVRLAVDIVRPTRSGVVHDQALPALWSHTPYTRAMVDENDTVAPSPIEGWGRVLPLVAHGYAVALVDVRGGGASFGRSNAMFSSAESKDAYEITEWLAAQAWCDGNIGMWGRSYLGITQFLCAAEQPPHLKAIFPEMAWWDAYDVIYPGGILRDDLVAMWSAGVRALDLGIPMLSEDIHGEPAVSWPAAPVDEDIDGSLIRAARREHHTNRDVGEFVRSNPFRDSFDQSPSGDTEPAWKPRSPSCLRDRIAESGVAIYNHVGWYDAFTRDACQAFANLPNPKKLLIDPHYHSEYLPDLSTEQLRWFDHWLKGVDNGIMDEDPVTYWSMGASHDDAWRSAPTWPPPDSTTATLSFSTDGSLTLDAAAAGDRTHEVDQSTTTGLANRVSNLYGGPGRVTPFEGGAHLGYPDMSPNDAKALCFTTPPLLHDVELVGHPIVRLEISASADLDLFVYLEEVRADGFSRYLSEGCLRTTHRATTDPPSPDNLGLPWHQSGVDDVTPLGNERAVMELDLQPVGVVVDQGSRLQVALACADQAAHLTSHLDSPATLTVHCGGSRSVIDLPVLGRIEFEDGVSM